MVSFGKKRKVVSKKRVTKARKVSKASKASKLSKVMYCIKQTKVGKRVVKVERVTRRGKLVQVYASSRRPIAKSVSCFRLKSEAKKQLTKLKAAKKSGFGSSTVGRLSAGKRTVKKIPRSYGFVVCEDPQSAQDGVKRYRPYKFFKIKFNQESYRIVDDKNKENNTRVLYMVPPEAKEFMVKVSKGDAERKRSHVKAKARANKLAREYELLGYAGVDLAMAKCSSNVQTAIASEAAKKGHMSVAAARNLGLGSQINDVNGYTSSMTPSGRFTSKNIPGFPDYNTTLTNGRFKVSNPTGEYGQDSNDKMWFNPRTKSLRRLSGTQVDSGNSFGRRFSPRFGSRINYGFSKYF